MMYSRTTVRIRDRNAFDKIFDMFENTGPEIEGSPQVKFWVPGMWLNMFGLAFQLIGMFLF